MDDSVNELEVSSGGQSSSEEVAEALYEELEMVEIVERVLLLLLLVISELVEDSVAVAMLEDDVLSA